jgi:hypothetical protein
MINTSLQIFCHCVASTGTISASHVRHLRETVLPDGAMEREDVDMLVALDRAVADSHPAWSEFLVATVVDFAVWSERGTGRVDAEAAQWLSATIGCGTGPTPNGARIAVEVVREAESVDERLVAFALDANRWLRAAPGDDACRPSLPLAA